MLIKPWNGGLPRGKDGNFFTAAIKDIAARIDQALKKLPALFKNPAVKLLCMHRSGRTVYNGPKAPVEPNMSLMTSTEECTFVRAVSEAPTAQEAVELWNPKLKTTPAKKLKRLNNPRLPRSRPAPEAGPGAEVEEGSTKEAAVTAAGVAASAAVGLADIVVDTAAEEAQRAVDKR